MKDNIAKLIVKKKKKIVNVVEIPGRRVYHHYVKHQFFELFPAEISFKDLLWTPSICNCFFFTEKILLIILETINVKG